MARKRNAAKVITPPRWDKDNRAVVINRVSDGRDRGHELQSDKDQAKRNLRWATDNGKQVVAAFNELDISGDGGREKLERALEMIEDREAAWLIVFHTDRLGRDNVSIYGSMERVDKAGGCIVAVGEGIDTSTDGGQDIMAILGRMAISARRRIARNWGRSQENAWIEGRYPGDIPFGLRQPTLEELLALAGTTEPGYPLLQHVPEQVDAIRKAAAHRLAGNSWPQVADLLTELTGGGGRATRKGERVARWSVNGARQLLLNPVMTGDVEFGDRFHAGAHEPIIPLADHQALHRMITRAGTFTGEIAHLLVGLLRCAGCRYTLNANHNGLSDKRDLAYRCRRRHCPNPVKVPAGVIEPLVEEIAFAVHDEEIETAVGNLAAHGLSLEAVDAREADWKARRRRFMSNLAALNISVEADEDAREEWEKLESEGHEIARERQTVERMMAPTGAGAAMTFRAVYEGESTVGKNAALKTVLDCVVVGDGWVFPYRNGTAPLKELPGKGRRVPFAGFVPPTEGPVQIRPLTPTGVEHPAV